MFRGDKIALSSLAKDECVRRVPGNARVGLFPRLQKEDRTEE